MRRPFAAILAVLLWAGLAGAVLGSAPLAGWVAAHRAWFGEAAVEAAAQWHAAMRNAGLAAPYAAIRRAMQDASAGT